MAKKEGKDYINKNIICPKCKYQNKPEYVMYSGVCNCCGEILDEKAYFKMQMHKKLRLWRGKRLMKWN